MSYSSILNKYDTISKMSKSSPANVNEQGNVPRLFLYNKYSSNNLMHASSHTILLANTLYCHELEHYCVLQLDNVLQLILKFYFDQVEILFFLKTDKSWVLQVHAGMSLHVQSKMITAREAASTEATLKWFGTCMLPEVPSELIRTSKPPFTSFPGTSVRLFPWWIKKKKALQVIYAY